MTNIFTSPIIQHNLGGKRPGDEGVNQSTKCSAVHKVVQAVHGELASLGHRLFKKQDEIAEQLNNC